MCIISRLRCYWYRITAYETVILIPTTVLLYALMSLTMHTHFRVPFYSILYQLTDPVCQRGFEKTWFPELGLTDLNADSAIH